MKLGSVAARLSQFPLNSFAVQSQKPAAALPHTSPFTPAFEELIDQNLHHYHVPGLAIAIIDGDDSFSRVSWRLCSSS